MKNYYTLLLTFLFIAAFSAAHSQVSMGIRAGVSFGSLSLQDQVLDNESMTTPAISLPVEIRLSPLVSIQPEISFVRKSGSLTRNLSSLSSNGSAASSQQTCVYDVDYLQTPVLIKISPSTKKLGVDVFWGPSFGMALRGNEKSTLVSTYEGETWTDSHERNLEIGGSGSEIQETEWSFIVGGGVNYSLPHGRILLDVRHQVGLGHVATIATDGKVAHQGTTVSFGYMIDLAGR